MLQLLQIHNQFKQTFSASEVDAIAKNETPEQLMLVSYLPRDSVVLEIGGGNGSTALVIDSILNENVRANHVVIEPSTYEFEMVQQRKKKLGAKFHVLQGFLASNRQGQEALWPDCKTVRNILLDEVLAVSGAHFSVLSVDCEGAFGYILDDFPELLDHAKLIFIEHDGGPEVKSRMTAAGFRCIHTQLHPYTQTTSMQQFLRELPGRLAFHEVWAKF